MTEMQSMMGNDSGGGICSRMAKRSRREGSRPGAPSSTSLWDGTRNQIAALGSLIIWGLWPAPALYSAHPAPALYSAHSAPYITTIQARPMFITSVEQTLTRQLESHISRTQRCLSRPASLRILDDTGISESSCVQKMHHLRRAARLLDPQSLIVVPAMDSYCDNITQWTPQN